MGTNHYQYKSINNNNSYLIHALIILSAIAMIGISLYLTQHYFDIKFPTGLAAKSACNINQFFNCDKTTLSKASNFFDIPISLFGIFFGVALLLNYLFRNDEVEGTNHFLAGLNLFGCIALFLYSLIGLKGLCPFCTLYYLLSALVFILFFRFSSLRTPSLKYLGIYLALALIPSYFVRANVLDKAKNQTLLKDSLITQYDTLEKLGNPKMESPFRIASSAEKFEDAPLQISIFSDFECPACRALSEYMAPIAGRYLGKINIQYFFYPLDMACNPKMTQPLHQYACKLAYAASCLPKEFAEIHDYLFQNQENLSEEWINKFVKEKKIEECYNRPETKDQVTKLISQGDDFDVRSTPTMIVNGVKIEGVLPISQLQMILDELLIRAAKK